PVSHDLRARILDIPQNKQPKFSFGFLKFTGAALVVLLVVVGTYFGTRTTPNNIAFDLTPQIKDVYGVDKNTTFILQASAKISASKILEIVKTENNVEYAVKSLGDNKFELIPKAPLEEEILQTFAISQGVADKNYSWTFQVKAPFQVIGTLPGNRTTTAPPATGIEIYTNRQNFSNLESSFTISPSIPGKLEQKDGRIVFAPRSRLKPSTVYTITLAKDLRTTDTNETLNSETTFAFEIENPQAGPNPKLGVSDDFYGHPGPKAHIYAWIYEDAITSINADIYEFSSGDDFIAAYQTSKNWDYSWTRHNQSSGVNLSKAKKLSSVALPVIKEEWKRKLEIPFDLQTGYYVIRLDDGAKGSYTFLEVHPFASLTSVTYDKSMLWLMNFKTKQPVKNASVSYAGQNIGSTNDKGLLAFNTPTAIQSTRSINCYGCDPKLPLVFKITTQSEKPYFSKPLTLNYQGVYEPSRFFEHVSTDRPFYKSQDTVQVFGFIKPRDNNTKIPNQVRAEIYKDYYGNPYTEFPYASKKPLAKAVLAVGSNGSYQGQLPIAGTAPGYYELIVRDGERVLSRTGVQVFAYTKPTYKLTAKPMSEYIYEGQELVYELTAAYYDESPVPNLKLNWRTYYGDQQLTGSIVLDRRGKGTVKITVPKTSNPQGYYDSWPKNLFVEFFSAAAETSFISTNVSTSVFGPKYNLGTSAYGVKSDGTNYYTVKVTEINPHNYAQGARGQDQPTSGVSVESVVKKTVYTKRQTGEYYDEVNKVVVPQYTYDSRSEEIQPTSGVTDSKGEWRFEKRLPIEEFTYYEIILTLKDPRGYTLKRSLSYFSNQALPSYGYMGGAPRSQEAETLQLTFDGDRQTFSKEFSEGEKVPLSVQFPTNVPKSYAADTLIIGYDHSLQTYDVVQNGRVEYSFKREFIPTRRYQAAVFSDHGFELTNPITANIKAEDMKITYEITPDKQSYKPGEKVKLSIKGTDKNKSGVSSIVNIAVVDEAIFALGGNYQPSITENILASRWTPPLFAYTSTDGNQGGDGGGGGGGDGVLRKNFKDTAFFTTVETASNGSTSVEFTLPDDITSFRVTVRGVNPKSLQSGEQTKNIVSTLPVYANPSIETEYLSGDKPQLKVQVGGSAFAEGTDSQINLTSKALSISGTQTTKNGIAYFETPALTPGNYPATFSVVHNGQVDKIEKILSVVPSRFARPQTMSMNLDSAITTELSKLQINPETMVELFFADATKGPYYQHVLSSSYTSGVRLDQQLTSYIGKALLAQHFGGTKPEQLELSSYIPTSGTGLAQFTYGDADLEASAWAAYVAPTLVPKEHSGNYFLKSLYDQKSDTSRQVIALFGLASLKQPVLDKVKFFESRELTLKDKLYIALAYQAAGDVNSSKAYYSNNILPATQSQTLSQDQTQNLKMAGMAAIVARAAGDSQNSERFWKLATTGAGVYDTNNLEKVGYLALTLKNIPAVDARFSYSLDNETTKIDLANGMTSRLELHAKDLAKLRFSEITGKASVAVSYITPSLPTERSSEVSISRSYTVVGGGKNIKEGDIVRVTLQIKAPKAQNRWFEVGDTLPSGLKPFTPTYLYEEVTPCTDAYWYPQFTQGTRVTFTVYPVYANSPCSRNYTTITYLARVSSVGTFKAEPAYIVELNNPKNINLSGEEVFHIGK
ncbi:MAG TPA: alpha-2-macroglobulin family protein, partial [Patescibacteria group bacterium]|nr:alpha-2-macroglobulin family protein [Patescibacteria group bacterium]